MLTADLGRTGFKPALVRHTRASELFKNRQRSQSLLPLAARQVNGLPGSALANAGRVCNPLLPNKNKNTGEPCSPVSEKVDLDSSLGYSNSERAQQNGADDRERDTRR